MTTRSTSLVVTGLALCGWLGACVPVTVVAEHPVPPTELLRQEDCAVYAQEVMRVAGPAAEQGDTSARVEALQKECRARFAGRVRRVILHCWHDSFDARTQRACDNRF